MLRIVNVFIVQISSVKTNLTKHNALNISQIDDYDDKFAFITISFTFIRHGCANNLIIIKLFNKNVEIQQHFNTNKLNRYQ